MVKFVRTPTVATLSLHRIHTEVALTVASLRWHQQPTPTKKALSLRSRCLEQSEPFIPEFRGNERF